MCSASTTKKSRMQNLTQVMRLQMQNLTQVVGAPLKLYGTRNMSRGRSSGGKVQWRLPDQDTAAALTSTSLAVLAETLGAALAKLESFYEGPLHPGQRIKTLSPADCGTPRAVFAGGRRFRVGVFRFGVFQYGTTWWSCGLGNCSE